MAPGYAASARTAQAGEGRLIAPKNVVRRAAKHLVLAIR
jgi:hypothetical protein